MTKLNLYCGILVPILTYGMQVMYANLGSLSASEIILKPATKSICVAPKKGTKRGSINLDFCYFHSTIYFFQSFSPSVPVSVFQVEFGFSVATFDCCGKSYKNRYMSPIRIASEQLDFSVRVKREIPARYTVRYDE